MNNQILNSEINHLELLNRGKVRDIYVLGDNHLLIVTTDRISAFDVILNQPIPGKGEVLNRISNFWFKRISHLLPNHLSDFDLSEAISDPEMRTSLGDRAIIVKKLKPLPIEAIVRGYLIGSGWKDYQTTGAVCGITLPENLRQADQLPEAIFTPSTKAEAGEHDQNIDYDDCVQLLGDSLADKVRNLSLQIYTEAAIYARERGIIIADTKFEFGVDDAGVLYLIDEVLTPDSSRFWPVSHYEPGKSPPSYDKQFVRDYLETLDWNKQPPAPDLPENIIKQTADKYREAEHSLTGK
ncbi:MAG: phosphoribosylaminoimidazolesuccinocarboxamide synthase [Gammaproteobacteria bacterium]|nr:phosphoribosylaminoimidazolesuccinocarboxamide synthase [Gammaproteobacteria bacterium]MCY4218390.1 phosphoribosylaminoimidazolesuccinocarboxamide synthase [Gammaproteobacteria bacterium]MCY4275569.1 phosphoribosylaminoimidazolesuccinocarboxamide synthase [Gammaproteobacteria bacterium]